MNFAGDNRERKELLSEKKKINLYIFKIPSSMKANFNK
jgi:hypothetical protein